MDPESEGDAVNADDALREMRSLAESLRPGASRLQYAHRGHRYEDDAERLAELVLRFDQVMRNRGVLPRDWKR